MSVSGTVPAAGAAQRPDLAGALERARARLLALQHPEGYWKGELASNVTMDAEDLLLREFLGIRTGEQTRQSAAWIRSQQREDGTWANFYGGPGDLSTTIEAYLALRLAGDPPGAAHMARAAAFIREAGGIARSRVFTRIWLALFGLWRWEALPALPPEVVLLPARGPFSIYDFACWARQTLVPLTVVWAFQPTRPLGLDLRELHAGEAPPPAPPGTRARMLARLDRMLHRYERRPPRALRQRALAAAERWILARQEADGSWGGIQPPWVWSLIALHLLGYANDHPVMRAGIHGLDGFTITEGGTRRLEACQSPVWDTALAVIALADAGLPPEHPALARAAGWLLGKEVRVRGDWAVRRPALPPGGWSFEFTNVNYPDVDDTAMVALALRRAAPPDPERARNARGRAVRWVVGMQSRDGGWGAFDADNTRTFLRDLPFCDFGEVTDPPSADVTAHAVELLAAEGLAGTAAAQRGVRWLLRAQEPDGAWFGRWGTNYVYGTGAVVPALVAAGIDPAHPAVRRAVRWLTDHQHPSGGWGEDQRSYRDPAWRGRGRPTASQTAWAMLALLAAGERGEPVGRAAAWLAATQRPDGSWEEPEFTGTGFPWDFCINYHLYRLVFPVTALGRYLRGGGPGH